MGELCDFSVVSERIGEDGMPLKAWSTMLKGGAEAQRRRRM